MPLSQETSLSLGKPAGPVIGPRQYAYRLGRNLRGRQGRYISAYREASEAYKINRKRYEAAEEMNQ